MNIREKVFSLVKYCGGYEGHSSMMDERNVDDFNIVLPQEQEIKERLPDLKFILLTGEAGDGKTRMLRNLHYILLEYGFKVIMDFSENDEEQRREIVEKAGALLEGKTGEKYILAANIGIFMKTALKYQPGLIEKLKNGGKAVLVINFERRNLAADERLFREIVREFLSFDRESPCEDFTCPWYMNCMYQKNMEDLADRGGEGFRVLCNAVYLTGGHITFRELLSLISYMVTFGQDCDRRRNEEEQEKYHYYQVFGIENAPLLQKFCCLDPAKGRARDVNQSYGSREECIGERRKEFFESKDMEAEKKYELLFADYLAEFRKVLRFINSTSPYYFSTIEAVEENLTKLKMGLSKITRAGNTNLKMTVADTPSMFDGSIQMEFDMNPDVETVWKRYDLDLKQRDRKLSEAGLENRFFLSYVYQDAQGELQEEDLLIDYPLFRFLMMAADDYHVDRNGISIEEYAVNAFYRKVLHSMPKAYQKAHVRFGETKKREFMNFSLELRQQNSFLFGDSRKVMIEKEQEV